MSHLPDEVQRQVRERWDPEFTWVENQFIPWAHLQKPVAQCRLVLITTGGLYLANQFQEPFSDHPHGDPSFREFPAAVQLEDLRIAHPGYDTAHAEADRNVVFPLDRLRELERSGVIGRLAPFHYSFMGHLTRPLSLLADSLPNLVERVRRAEADVALIGAVSPLCHQTAGLISRALEAAGIPTLVVGVEPSLWERVRPPRAVWSRHPFGAPFGQPGNRGKQTELLRMALEALETMQTRGSVWELPLAWRD
ncbi:MAG: glycine/sarcosine/betaine reductase selenoprotein B family protein [Bacillota bacterium]